MALKKDDQKLPDTIVGGLPSPDEMAKAFHRVNGTHFHADGAAYSCICGAVLNCTSEADFRTKWENHIRV